MKNLRLIVVLVVAANLAVVAFLLLQKPAENRPTGVGEAIAPLLDDTTQSKATYDLGDKKGELNLIVISMDALRHDRTGFGGNPDGLTPNLDAFMEEAVVFQDAAAVASWTLPSHMSLWTARWPSIHGVTNKLKLLSQDQMVPTSLSPGIESFPDHLIRAGFTAGGFTGGAGVQASYGFGRNFDTWLDDKPFAGFDYSAGPALEWLKTNASKRFFLFLHGYDAHGQHDLTGLRPRDVITDYHGTLDGSIEEQAKLREQGLANIKNPGDGPDLTGVVSKEDAAFLEKVYDLKVKQADERVGAFLSQLKAMGLYDRSIIAIVSDHGDEFMEHGYLDHGPTLCQHQLHVVMGIRFPGFTRRNDVKTPVRLFDLFPTLFDALGLTGPTGVDGQSLMPLLRGEKLDLPMYAESDYRLFVHLRSVRQGKKKLVLDLADGGRVLYDLAGDPDEAHDGSSADPRATYEMEQAVRRWLETTRTNPQDYLGLKQAPIKLF